MNNNKGVTLSVLLIVVIILLILTSMTMFTGKNSIEIVKIQNYKAQMQVIQNEIDEIWITFPDPQLREKRAKKRLTSPRFLNMYLNMLKPNAVVNLKTDSKELFDYTKALLEYNNHEIIIATDDLYNSTYCTEDLSIKTHYESYYLTQGKKITYLQFKITHESVDLPTEV